MFFPHVLLVAIVSGHTKLIPPSESGSQKPEMLPSITWNHLEILLALENKSILQSSRDDVIKNKWDCCPGF